MGGGGLIDCKNDFFFCILSFYCYGLLLNLLETFFCSSIEFMFKQGETIIYLSMGFYVLGLTLNSSVSNSL